MPYLPWLGKEQVEHSVTHLVALLPKLQSPGATLEGVVSHGCSLAWKAGLAGSAAPALASLPLSPDPQHLLPHVPSQAFVSGVHHGGQVWGD